MKMDGVTLFSPLPDDERAGIVTISLVPPLDPRTVFDKLRERGATIAIREGKLRYSPHFYNSAEDMDRVADMTEEAIREAHGG
jgi:selenocysteine lyase/cysteine desulfurase